MSTNETFADHERDDATSARAIDVLPDPEARTVRRFRLRRHATLEGAIATQAAAPAEESVPEDTGSVTLMAPSVASRQVPSQARSFEGGFARGEMPDLMDRAEFLSTLAASLPATSPLVLVQFGLDNFRHLNAAVGPNVGDAVLGHTGRVLAWSFAPNLVARVGGDSFAVLLPYDGLAKAQEQVGSALARIAATDLSDDGTGVRATASVGITVLDRPGLTPAGVLLEADLAMAAAKKAGRNRLAVHDTMEDSTTTAVHVWAAQIRKALEEDTFVLHAQPVRSVRDGAGQWELLVRLPAADGELLPPSEFLPIAERFGLMQQVDEWVTQRAVAMVAAHGAVGQPIRLEINIGESTLASQSFVAMVEGELKSSGVDPSCLVFEVNGTTAAANLDDVKVFAQRLGKLGCLFAIDGFGRNSGALEQLKVLPLNFVKIDGSFVRHLADNTTDQHIVHGLTQIAHALGCLVIAMSVGDDKSLELLEEYGVDYVQGFHVGRPEPLVPQSLAAPQLVA